MSDEPSLCERLEGLLDRIEEAANEGYLECAPDRNEGNQQIAQGARIAYLAMRNFIQTERGSLLTESQSDERCPTCRSTDPKKKLPWIGIDGRPRDYPCPNPFHRQGGDEGRTVG